MHGWIKVHRKMLSWEWMNDPPTAHLWLVLLLLANHRRKKWREMTIERGQIITGRRKLAEISGLSEQQVRTALRRLRGNQQIDQKSTNKYTLITIRNYKQYQDCDEASQPIINQQTNHNQEVKEEKKKRNNNYKNNYRPENHRPSFISEKDWADLIKHRRAMKNPQTERAYNGLVKEIQQAMKDGHTLEHILETYFQSSWKGFFARYMKPKRYQRKQVRDENPWR